MFFNNNKCFLQHQVYGIVFFYLEKIQTILNNNCHR